MSKAEPDNRPSLDCERFCAKIWFNLLQIVTDKHYGKHYSRTK